MERGKKQTNSKKLCLRGQEVERGGENRKNHAESDLEKANKINSKSFLNLANWRRLEGRRQTMRMELSLKAEMFWYPK